MEQETETERHGAGPQEKHTRTETDTQRVCVCWGEVDVRQRCILKCIELSREQFTLRFDRAVWKGAGVLSEIRRSKGRLFNVLANVLSLRSLQAQAEVPRTKLET